MKLLLDTHVYLWSRTEPSRLAAKERAALRDPGNELFLSVAKCGFPTDRMRKVVRFVFDN